MESREILEQKYQALPPEIKYIVELLAYSCCPISKSTLERLELPFEKSKSKRQAIILSLKDYLDIIWPSKNILDSYYVLEPHLSLHLLLQLEKQKRDFKKEIRNTNFWNAANYLGKRVRDTLIKYYYTQTPFSYLSVANQNIHAKFLLDAALDMPEFSGIEHFFPITKFLETFEAEVDMIDETLELPPNFEHTYQRTISFIGLNPPYLEKLEKTFARINTLLPGDLSRISGENAVNAEGYYLQGMYHLYKGDYPLAIKHFEAGMKLAKTDIPQWPFYNYGYAIALMLDKSEQSNKRIAVLSKKKSMQEEEAFPAALLFMIHKNTPAEELHDTIRLRDIMFSTSLVRLLVHTILQHHDLALSFFGTNKHLFVPELQKNGWDLLLLETSAPYPELQETRVELEKKLGITPLISRIKVIPEWEKTLELLLPTKREKTAGTKSTSRIVYLIDPKYHHVQPTLQQSKDGITWSAGRNIALKRYSDRSLQDMSEVDEKIARLVKQSYSYNGTSYYMNATEAIACLAGYPLVFLASNPRIPVEIVEEKPELVIRQQADGFTITSNAGAPDSTILITWETQTRAKVIHMTTEQYTIISTLQRVKTFPPEAKERLLELIKHLNGNIVVHSDLIGDQEQLPTIKGDSRIVVQLLPIGDSLRAELFCKPFGEVPPYCKPGKGAKSVTGIVNEEKSLATRDLDEEKRFKDAVLADVERLSDDYDGDAYVFHSPESCLNLLETLKHRDEITSIEWPEGVRYRIKHYITGDNLHLSLTGRNQWFDLEGELRVGEETIMTISELLQACRHSKGRFIPIGDKEYLSLTQTLKRRLEELESMSVEENNRFRIQQFASPVFDNWEEEGIQLTTDKRFKDLQKKIEKASRLKPEIPVTLKADLREYQKDGFEWMARLEAWGAGGCLADDMGLGKTVQAITMLLHVARKGPSLVICPASVLPNWEHELRRFAPTLNIYRLNSATERQQTITAMQPGDVLLATYGMLVSEEKGLTGRPWQMIVLDEAHAIKNRTTKMSKAAMKLQADFRLILTGTPIQNHLGELWNLFQFINPGLLGSLEHFTERYVQPITQLKDKSCQNQLKRLLSPFLLRRTKNAVLDELPPKTEIIRDVELSEAEMAQYELLRREAEMTLADATNGDQLKIIAEITRLRLAACNINLVNKAFTTQASKVETFLNIVNELKANNHRALVFSQFTSHLALIRQALDQTGISYLYLDGSTPIRQREQLVAQFQEGTSLLFLISLKAGGLGLNLTAADFVIHMDPWWNPAVEDQASDRTYRIGQTRPVTIYRLIAKGTIEEKIIRLHHTKKDLADSLLEGTDLSHKLTREEILELLRQE